MRQRFSIGVVLVLGVALAVSVSLLARSHETDIYLAALKPYSDLSPVLYSSPTRCGLQTPEHEGIDSNLLDSFFRANSDDAKGISLSRLRDQFAIADTSKLNSYRKAGVSSDVLISGERGLLGLSRVGFNSDRSEALFCIEGIGTGLVQLQLLDGQWKEVHFTDVLIR